MISSFDTDLEGFLIIGLIWGKWGNQGNFERGSGMGLAGL